MLVFSLDSSNLANLVGTSTKSSYESNIIHFSAGTFCSQMNYCITDLGLPNKTAGEPEEMVHEGKVVPGTTLSGPYQIIG